MFNFSRYSMAYLNSVLIGTLIIWMYTINNVNGIKLASKENGIPLFLTPYIERGDIEKGREAALVKSFLSEENIVSYSGFLTVNNTYFSNMFFWFFLAENNSINAPLVLWLQGGPGRSSIYGLFEQIGSYYIDKEGEKLMKREYSWSKMVNILYIDNPVGTGFSFTEDDDGYSKTEREIGRNLYITLQQFFQLFPHFKKNDFYIAGSSYAGKFIPALAYTIDKKQENSSTNDKINLKGLIIGNGYFDPKTIIQRSDILYQLGLIDLNFKLELEKYINKLISLINQMKFEEALDFEENVMRKAVTMKIGYKATFNFLNDTLISPFGDVYKFINSDRIRNLLHVGDTSFNTDPKVDLYLRNDIMRSVKPWIEYLLEKYRILIYNGQLDLIVTYSSIVKFLQSLNWSEAYNYKNAERHIWYVDNELAGYKKTVGKLTEVLVRNAGHSAAIDKPKYIFSLIKNFIFVESN